MGEQLQRGDSAVADPPRRWPRRLVWAMVLAAVAITLYGSSRRSGALDCAAAVRDGTDALAAVVCQEEYERTRRPATGASLAEALRRSGDLTAAAGLATELLGTDARADALAVLGQIAAAQQRLDDAASALLEARKLHRAVDRRRELARDDLALAEVHRRRDQHAEALLSLDECVAEARGAADAPIEGACHVAAAGVLARVGRVEEAHQELDRAEPALALDRDLARLWLERGELERIAGGGPGRRVDGERAARSLERALGHATRARLPELALAIHLRLADALAELRQPDPAERHLAEAGLLDRDGRHERDRARLAARLAYRRGDLALAAALGERAYASDGAAADGAADDRIALAVMQARIALAGGDLPAAERWARRGVAAAEQLRGSPAAAEPRPWIWAARREPLEVLFHVLALGGRADDAAAVLDAWQGRALLDAMARPGPGAARGLAGAAAEIRALGQWLPAAASAPLLQGGRGGAVAAPQALRRIDLIALAVADGQVWRLTASRGRLRIEPRGALADLAERLGRFADAPTDRALADELGALLLPDDAVRATDEPLYVVLDEALAALPVVALRRGGRPLVAARPVLRAPRLPAPSRCAAPAAAGRALIFADAGGDLPDARREASYLAAQLGTTAQVGEAATAAALLAARPAALLHVAVPAGQGAGGGVLRLYDRALGAPEIAGSRLSAALVVLAGGAAARADDGALATSLSTAFLAGGAGHVVAALGPVSDAGARELVRRFYAAGGAADPTRALARVQAALAAENGAGDAWPRFAAFAADACAPGS